MYGVVLIAVMVITGGIIAFIGDKLGTKIGKKRLSIFGLRPRHTSIIVTIITGSLITGLSIGTLAIVSKDVRTALFGMEELNATMAATRSSLAIVTQDLTQMREEYARAENDLGTARHEITKLKSEQTELEKESERLREGNERLETEKAALTSQNERLSTTNRELADSNNELESKNVELSNSNVSLTTDNEKLTKDKEDLEEHTKNLREGLMAIREGDIVFRAGEVLASASITGNRPAEAVAVDMNKLANVASRNIAERFGEDIGDTSVWIYQPEFQSAVDTISESSGDIVVRISAAGNLVRGEPVRTSLSLYPNELIYTANEYIYSNEYEVKTDEDAENIVRDFFAEINRLAVERGVLADPLTGNVGVMDGAQLYELMEKLENSRGKVTLTARARDEVKSIGPLRLNIDFKQRNKK